MALFGACPCRRTGVHFTAPEAVVGMAVYSARAMLQGKGRDVWEMMVENIP
jgi:pyruvate dehydrogenase (quinone)